MTTVVAGTDQSHICRTVEIEIDPDALVIESDATEAEESTPRKKRRKGTSPTARSLAEGRKRGYEIQVVERRVPRVFTTLDLFGVLDLVAIVPADGRPNRWRVVGIQATSGANHASRRAKILAEPRAAKWVEAGCGLELWSWSLRVVGKSRRWTLRVETYQEMLRSVGPASR